MAKIDKLVNEALNHLEAGEKNIAAVMGAYECKIMGKDTLRNGVFLATDRRIFFYGKKMFGFDAESFPYSNISSYEFGKGAMGRTISFFASGNKVRMKWINIGEVDSFMSVIQEKAGKKEQSADSKESVDVVDQIKRLAELRDQGILTEEEFSAKKQKLLGI
ncbi:hypothetical protein D3C81_309200 [compost metagenome]